MLIARVFVWVPINKPFIYEFWKAGMYGHIAMQLEPHHLDENHVLLRSAPQQINNFKEHLTYISLYKNTFAAVEDDDRKYGIWNSYHLDYEKRVFDIYGSVEDLINMYKYFLSEIGTGLAAISINSDPHASYYLVPDAINNGCGFSAVVPRYFSCSVKHNCTTLVERLLEKGGIKLFGTLEWIKSIFTVIFQVGASFAGGFSTRICIEICRICSKNEAKAYKYGVTVNGYANPRINGAGNLLS
jgi:hypothetical protein